jgi:hypothetical protein
LRASMKVLQVRGAEDERDARVEPHALLLLAVYALGHSHKNELSKQTKSNVYNRCLQMVVGLGNTSRPPSPAHGACFGDASRLASKARSKGAAAVVTIFARTMAAVDRRWTLSSSGGHGNSCGNSAQSSDR